MCLKMTWCCKIISTHTTHMLLFHNLFYSFMNSSNMYFYFICCIKQFTTYTTRAIFNSLRSFVFMHTFNMVFKISNCSECCSTNVTNVIFLTFMNKKTFSHKLMVVVNLFVRSPFLYPIIISKYYR